MGRGETPVRLQLTTARFCLISHIVQAGAHILYYLVRALPSEKATDTIHKKIEKLIVKDLQKKPGNPGFLASE